MRAGRYCITYVYPSTYEPTNAKPRHWGKTHIYFPQRGTTHKRADKFRFPFSMASAPPPRAPLSSLRFSWPTGCSHEKMPAEAPIELRMARPMVPSAQGDSTELKSKNLQTMNFMPPSLPFGWQRVGWVRHPAHRLSSSGCSSPRTRRPHRASPPQRSVHTSTHSRCALNIEAICRQDQE